MKMNRRTRDQGPAAVIRNVFKIPDLRKRILFTFALLAVYRVGCNIPIPGVDLEVLFELMQSVEGSLLGFVNVFSGRGLERAAVFALGLFPYITASIVLQLLTVTVPRLEKLSKEGEMGRRRITQYTRYLTLVMAAVESASIALAVEATNAPGGAPLVPDPGWGFRLTTVLTLTTGCLLVMWLGEQISERGLGNGISLIIFAGIVSTVPGALGTLYTQVEGGLLHPVTVFFLGLFVAALTAFIVRVERTQRRVPIQYARRIQGRGVYGGQKTYLPLKLNLGGVIPVIFASSIVVLPRAVAGLAPADWTFLQGAAEALGSGQPLYYLLFAATIVFFSFFYVSIIFNPWDVADNLRKQGGFIPGVRAGRLTADYLDRVLTRLTTIGAVYLAGVAILPELLIFGLRVEGIPFVGTVLDRLLPAWLTTGIGVDFYFGGTSLLIVVGVAMDFVNQVESRLVMHNYDSFLTRGRNN